MKLIAPVLTFISGLATIQATILDVAECNRSENCVEVVFTRATDICSLILDADVTGTEINKPVCKSLVTENKMVKKWNSWDGLVHPL